MSPLAIVGIIGAVGCLPFMAIVAAILFPVFAKAREKARITSSESNLKQIGLATLQFTEDHDEKLPPTDSSEAFKAAVNQYVLDADGKLFVQPGAGVPYAFNAQVSKHNLSDYSHPEAIVLAREAVPHPDGERAVLYLDGHVTVLRDDESNGEQTSSPN